MTVEVRNFTDRGDHPLRREVDAEAVARAISASTPPSHVTIPENPAQPVTMPHNTAIGVAANLAR